MKFAIILLNVLAYLVLTGSATAFVALIMQQQKISGIIVIPKLYLKIIFFAGLVPYLNILHSVIGLIYMLYLGIKFIVGKHASVLNQVKQLNE